MNFVVTWLIPAVCTNHTVNVTRTINSKVLFCLMDVNTIVVFCKSKIVEGSYLFVMELEFLADVIKNFLSSRFVFARNEEVINLL